MIIVSVCCGCRDCLVVLAPRVDDDHDDRDGDECCCCCEHNSLLLTPSFAPYAFLAFDVRPGSNNVLLDLLYTLTTAHCTEAQERYRTHGGSTAGGAATPKATPIRE